ncbi:hypothetical protein ACJ73_01378 [Blastomyces percursus]|uniref:Uncharacterized protein n=1 Tax=Blastomyces percursus TaxID=1658174 RepID=A0A1J9RGW1_9EURO|nr:hypothetical protein ACJ73_01378 [Blastomyces percursus]
MGKLADINPSNIGSRHLPFKGGLTMAFATQPFSIRTNNGNLPFGQFRLSHAMSLVAMTSLLHATRKYSRENIVAPASFMRMHAHKELLSPHAYKLMEYMNASSSKA